MAKKNKRSPQTSSPQIDKLNLEKSPFFVPAVFLVLLIALIILFNSFVFSDKMLHGSDTIQAGIFFRAMLVDFVLDHGHIPQWNPYIFGGMPFVEAFHGDIFYPLSFLKYFGSIFRMLGWILFLHIFLAGIFMYFCARQFRLSKTSSLLSGISFMFAAYLVSLVAPGHDGKIFVTALFPLVILFLDRGFRSSGFLKSLFNFSVFGLVIGVIILSPHLQMAYFTLWAAALYSLFFLISSFVKEKNIPKLIRPAFLAVYGVVIGLLISAIQFYPGYIYTNDFSPRADSKSGWEWATSWSMHEEEAMSLMVPEYVGVFPANRDYSRDTYYWGKNAFKDNSESVSVVAIFLAFIGLFFTRKKETYFFAALALFAFLYALGGTTPVFKIFFYLIPKVKSLRAPSMIMFLFSFSIALLAGFGLQTIIDKSREWKADVKKKFNILLLGFPALSLLIALLLSVSGQGFLDFWTSTFYSEAKTTMIQQGVSKFSLATMNLPAAQSGAWLAFLFITIAALLIWSYQNRKIGVALLSLILVIPVINGVRFNKRFVEVENQNQLFPATSQLVTYLQNNIGNARVMNLQALPEDFLPHYQISVVTGYHGNQLRWFDRLLGGVGSKNKFNPHLLNLTGAEYLALPAQQQLPPDYFGPKTVSEAGVMSSGGKYGMVRLYKNNNALPRAYLVDNFMVLDTAEIYNKVLSGADDFGKVVYLEDQPKLSYKADSINPGSVEIVEYENESVKLTVSCPDNKILVLTDNYYDAWHVKIDGADGDILRSYGSFRAVELPAGSKDVEFYFDSPRYGTGKTVTWLTVIFLLGIFGFYGFNEMKNRKNMIDKDDDNELE